MALFSAPHHLTVMSGGRNVRNLSGDITTVSHEPRPGNSKQTDGMVFFINISCGLFNTYCNTCYFPWPSSRRRPGSVCVPTGGMGPGSVPSLRYFHHWALCLLCCSAAPPECNQHFLNPSRSHTPGQPRPAPALTTSRDPGAGDENIRWRRPGS